MAIPAWILMYYCLCHPLAKFWSMASLFRRKWNPDLQKLHQHYGPVVRVGPNQLSFSSIESHRMIYNSKPVSTGPDTYFLKAGTMHLLFSMITKTANLGTIANHSEHRTLRKHLHSAFTLSAVFKQEGLMRLHIDRALERIAQINGPVDLTEAFSVLAWEMIGDLSFGEPLVPERRRTLSAVVEWWEKTFFLLEGLNHVIPNVEAVMKLAGRLAPQVTLRSILPGTTLRNYIDRQDGRSDFLTLIMGGENERGKTNLDLSYDELHSNATLLVLAGNKTSEAALSAIFHHLLANPEVLQALRTELHSHFTNIEDIAAAKLLSLDYLNGCINESLRLAPPLSGKVACRRCPGVEMEGFYVPAGTEVYADVFTLQRNDSYWHAADEYRPQRWFQRNEGSPYANDVHEAFKPFGLGPRSCIGKELALQTLRLTTALVVHRFKLASANLGEFVWDRDAASGLGYANYRVLAHAEDDCK
ncbi:hypothetical protein BDW74DRAFT_169779 [Aspergillus multicolor]|uniref:uncharacterized protein n=1 Tax=Aspergillus multicolor TaxID=41759 RepID=UPI003CCCCDFB